MAATLKAIEPGAEARRAVVDALREHLRRAEAGGYRSVHLAAFLTDGSLTSESAGDYNIFETIAALEWRKHRIMHQE